MARGRESPLQTVQSVPASVRSPRSDERRATWVLGILKLKGHMQVLGLNLGKKQGLRQTFPAFEKSQDKEELQVQAQFFDGKSCYL